MMMRLGLLAVLATLFAGCATSKLASTWRDPDDRGTPLKKVAVFVVSKDDNQRRFAEDMAVRSLPRGTVGVPSYKLSAQPEQDAEKLKSLLAKDGFDGAVVARLVSHDRNQTYVPPQTHIVPSGPAPLYPHYRSFYGYYGWAYQSYTTPGYVAETERIIVETMVYRLPEGKPVWSGVTESVNPESSLDLVQELVRILKAELQKSGLIAPS